jgi:hypothetical protein
MKRSKTVMTRLAIIDVDGIIANVDARFEQAKADAEGAFVDRAYEKRDYDNVYWRAVFNPEYVPMDTLIEGAREAIDCLLKENYTVFFLTSRTEAMRLRTEEWLHNHRIVPIWEHNRLIMKAPAFQYVKTAVWKAGMVQTLEALYEATDLLIIDDEQANIDEHLKYFSNIQTRELCKSLAEAVAKLQGTWVEPDPFMPAE